MKRELFIIAMLLLSTFTVFIPTDVVKGDPAGGTIEGDMVYWENEYARLEVSPHTSTEIIRQRQWANLTWKEVDDTIDVAFRFEDALTSGKIWYWNNDIWNEVTVDHTEYGGNHYYYYDGFNVVQDTTYQFKWEYDTTANTQGKWWLFAKLDEHTIQQALDNDWYVALDPWWDSAWSDRIDLTINHDYIDNNIKDLPILVYINSTIMTGCQGDLDDIRFVSSDNTTEYYYDIDYTSASGSYVWVRMSDTISSSVDTHFNFYFGNGGASAGEDEANTYMVNYTTVHHLENSGDTTIYDITSNNNDFTERGTMDRALNFIGYSADFGTDGGTDGSYGDAAGGDGSLNEYTVSYWAYEETMTHGDIYHLQTTSGAYMALNPNSPARMNFFGAEYTTYSQYPQSWYYYVGTCDGSDAIGYINGSFVVTGSVTTNLEYPRWLGATWDDLHQKDGYMDEFRIENVVRNATWIKADYHNQNLTSDFLIWSPYFSWREVYVNETTDITSGSAKLHGFIPDNGVLDGSYTTGFWIGQTSPVTVGNADQNVSVGSYTPNDEFEYDVHSLLNDTIYYISAWAWNTSHGLIDTNSVNQKSFTTLVETVQVNSTASITTTTATLNGWSNISSGTHDAGFWVGNTYPMTEANILFNVSDDTITSPSEFSYDITLLDTGTLFYVTAWVSNATDWYVSPLNFTFYTVPLIVSTFTGEYNQQTEEVDFTWTKDGNGTIYLQRKEGSYPTDYTDGTNIYTGIGDYYNDSTVVKNTTYYYRLWTYSDKPSTDYEEVLITANISVLTLATDDIAETTATLNGWIADLSQLNGNYECGFWYGTTSPVNESNADGNVSSGSIAKGTFFDYPATGLTVGTKYYVEAWARNVSYFINGTELNFTTIPIAPTGLSLTLDTANNGVDVSWTHTGTTVVVRKSNSYPANPTDGTEIYNSTGNSYDDDNIAGTHWYYRVWSYANPFSNANASANILVPPAPPTGVTSEILSNISLKIEWTKGQGAVDTIIVKKSGSYPTSPTDGTVAYNNTGLEFFEESISGTLNYYTLFSHANGSFSNGVDITQGGFVVYCFDAEGEPLNFDVLITNQTLHSYEYKNATNPLIINTTDTPYGDKTSVKVSAAEFYNNNTETFSESAGWTFDNYTMTYLPLLMSPDDKETTNVSVTNTTSGITWYPAFTIDTTQNVIEILAGATPEFDTATVRYKHQKYRPRWFYQDLEQNVVFLLSAYLERVEDVFLFQARVTDQYNNPIENALLTFKQYVNGSWVNISKLYTSGAGNTELYLQDGIEYVVILTKTNYVTKQVNFIANALVPYEDFILPVEITGESSQTGNLQGLDYTQGWIGDSIFLDIYDTRYDASIGDGITDATCYLYFASNNTLINTSIQSIPYDFNYTYSPLNTSYNYYVSLIVSAFYENGEDEAGINDDEIWTDYEIRFYYDRDYGLSPITSPDLIDDIFNNTIGKTPFYIINGDVEQIMGWSSAIVLMLAIYVLWTFSKAFAGVGLFILGLLISYLSLYIGILQVTASILTVGAFLCMLGIMVYLNEKKVS